MKNILLVFLIMFSLTAFSQKMLKGIVIDSALNKPIPRASIFLNNTSIGTRTDDEGKFQLWIPQGKYEMIVSSVGYETFNSMIVAIEQPDFIRIELNVKTEELENVVIETVEKDGWKKWGQAFTDNFIGNSSFSNQCKIINPEVINFRYTKTSKILTAKSIEPLIIENSALGYTIHYSLELFSLDFNKRLMTYTGYPFFEFMEGNERKNFKWEKNRKEAYYGSMLHFMRALFSNKITDEGFEVRTLKRTLNHEKQRVRKILDSLSKQKIQIGYGSKQINKDSSAYYQQVITHPYFFEVTGENILTKDSIAYEIDDKTTELKFEDYLAVFYTKKMAPIEYKSSPFQKSRKEMQSYITLTENSSIEVQSNGSYYYPTDLLTFGYWAWSEKMSMLLPFNYQPTKE